MARMPYREAPDESYIRELLKRMDHPHVVLTGVSYEEGTTGVLVKNGDSVFHYTHPKIGKSYHGTGDIFASAFVGAIAGGKTMEQAAAIAAEYVALCIRKTMDDPSHWYGVKFETAIGDLVQMLNK